MLNRAPGAIVGRFDSGLLCAGGYGFFDPNGDRSTT